MIWVFELLLVTLPVRLFWLSPPIVNALAPALKVKPAMLKPAGSSLLSEVMLEVPKNRLSPLAMVPVGAPGTVTPIVQFEPVNVLSLGAVDHASLAACVVP